MSNAWPAEPTLLMHFGKADMTPVQRARALQEIAVWALGIVLGIAFYWGTK